MNITFLIGNGFDIQMGIDSSYKLVKAHYVGLKKDNPILKSFQNSITGDDEYWANFESALGQYTDKFQEDKQTDFQLCLDDFTDELIQYLQSEESKIDYDLCADVIKKEFVRSISKYDADIPAKYKNALNAIISQNAGVTFRFISFNYTHILDQCLRIAFSNDTVVGKHTLNGSNYNHVVKEDVLHIHGELPGPIIMGVDNSNQILNKKWAGQRRFLQKLAKPEMNARAGSLIDERVTRLINESNIICVFGMSLGETDKTWWKQIASWLYGTDHRLVLFAHNDDYSGTGLTHQRQFAIQDEIIDRFLDLADISGQNRETLERKIYAIINPDLFRINLVDLTSEKKAIYEIEQDATIKSMTAELEKAQKLAELSTVT